MVAVATNVRIVAPPFVIESSTTPRDSRCQHFNFSVAAIECCVAYGRSRGLRIDGYRSGGGRVGAAPIACRCLYAVLECSYGVTHEAGVLVDGRVDGHAVAVPLERRPVATARDRHTRIFNVGGAYAVFTIKWRFNRDAYRLVYRQVERHQRVAAVYVGSCKGVGHYFLHGRCALSIGVPVNPGRAVAGHHCVGGGRCAVHRYGSHGQGGVHAAGRVAQGYLIYVGAGSFRIGGEGGLVVVHLNIVEEPLVVVGAAATRDLVDLERGGVGVACAVFGALVGQGDVEGVADGVGVVGCGCAAVGVGYGQRHGVCACHVGWHHAGVVGSQGVAVPDVRVWLRAARHAGVELLHTRSIVAYGAVGVGGDGYGQNFRFCNCGADR